MNQHTAPSEYMALLDALKQHVITSRYRAVLSVNRELILLYHHIGCQILDRTGQ